MQIVNRIAFIIVWVGVITITGVVSFTAGELKYQRLDHSAITINHWKTATKRFRNLYYQAKKENDFFKENIKNKIYETNNPH
jgi:hypothetical protein